MCTEHCVNFAQHQKIHSMFCSSTNAPHNPSSSCRLCLHNFSPLDSASGAIDFTVATHVAELKKKRERVGMEVGFKEVRNASGVLDRPAPSEPTYGSVQGTSRIPRREGIPYHGPPRAPVQFRVWGGFWGGTYGFSDYLRAKNIYSPGNYSDFRPDLRITSC